MMIEDDPWVEAVSMLTWMEVALANRQTLLLPTDQSRSYFEDLSSADLHSLGQLVAYDRHHLCSSSIQ